MTIFIFFIKYTIFNRYIISSKEIFDAYNLKKANKKGFEITRTKIDLEDVNKCKNFKWGLSCGYAVNSNKNGEKLHRFLMNPSNNECIDHINRDKLDNRKCNLRICTQAQNSYNHNIRSNNKSGVVGVCWSNTYKLWIAYIGFENKRIKLGKFSSLEDAIKARREAELKYHKEFSPRYNESILN